MEQTADNNRFSAIASRIIDVVGQAKAKGIFYGKTAFQWMLEAAQQPDPVQLWMSLWYENEVACLFADTNMGKSIYAIQIAEAVALTGRKVAYFDFEMSAKQFQLRYTDPETRQMYRFCDNFLRVEMEATCTNLDDIQYVIREIERFCRENAVRVVIIDNISWITNRCESGDAAGELMQELLALKKRMGMSVLVLAHTPKRNIASMLTQNSLAGSKRLANFFDAMFAIGKANARGSEYRYVKQIKIRSGEMEFDTDSVLLYRLEKEGAFLSFREEGTANEIDLLPMPGDGGDETSGREEEAKKLLMEGVPVREVCRQLSMGTSKVMAIRRRISSEATL